MFNIELEQEDDQRWIAEVADLPGVLAYGQTREEAIANVKALALRVLADRIEQVNGFLSLFRLLQHESVVIVEG